MVDDIKPHIIGITESWAHKDITDVVQCLRGVLCAWRVREVSLQMIHKGPLGKHNNQGGRLLPRQ